ncbi:hypothetical protein INS49_008132 [Diaporthe citri]|uniref:uncharacterized protein n=1 Tax=Diaporthe citri TaxID=83186 RepID=UPI001C8173F8|nr:uncharacterized protein INS49_008132 [Diaporthe citri]KAG6363037.1 hypothetical protein INS49_008132 [Diaporthe citri]
MREMPMQMKTNKEKPTRDSGQRDGVLTKSFPARRDTPYDRARAEHHEYADLEDDQRAAFPKHQEDTLPDSGDSSHRYTERPELLEGWSAPALGRDQMSSFTGQPSIKGRNESIRMMLLCAIHFGITFTWGVEMTYCTPYLLNLGLTKSQTSVVWIAGPLSGIITQPIVGVLADSNKSRWGRRRPYIFIGTIIVSASLLLLGWTREIVAWLLPMESDFRRKFTIFVAVLALYVTDFAINAVMSCSRSLLVDTLPIAKQQTGAAWGGRMGSFGHIVGYAIGAIDLPGTFGPRLGDTQFKQLTLIASMSMLFTAGVTCWAVTERVLVSVRQDPSRSSEGRFKVIRQIWSTLIDLPPRIQIICWAMFWAWIGWFPFHFYGSTWVGETYFRYDATANAAAEGSTLAPSDALGDMGRIGSYTLTIYSFMTFAGAWLLPLVVRAPEDEKFTHRPPASIANLVEGFSKLKPDLLTVWQSGHLMFACAMFLAPFAKSFRFATALVVFCGIPWSIVSWAPTATMGMEVNKLSTADMNTSYRRLSNADSVQLSTIHLEHGAHEDGTDGNSGSTGELSGIYFGILNIYQTIPQFIGSFISTIVFSILEPGKSPELATDAHPSEHHSTTGPNAISVCLFIGAIAACAAFVATRKLKYTP